MKRYFVVSDIHSFYEEFISAINEQGFDQNDSSHIVVICGDAFDRGDSSVKLFEWMKIMKNQDRLVYIRGNHEDLLEKLIQDIRKQRNIDRHHISNGSVKTIAEFCNCSMFDIIFNSFNHEFFDTRISQLMEFINNTSVDYFEIGNTLFVHGWVPITADVDKTMIVHENFRDGSWKEARWENGMELFHSGITLPCKTIVCGHWHASFGWSNYARKCSEWDSDAIFTPYIEYDEKLNSTIVAIDGCTVFTRSVNCVVFNENGEIISNIESFEGRDNL